MPFGDRVSVDDTFDEFLASLKVGDLIDAVKSISADTKHIWSRAVVTDLKVNILYVSFVGESQAGSREI